MFWIVFSLAISLFADKCEKNWDVQSLSMEEKVGQLFMVHFHGRFANEEAKKLIEELHVGGVIYYNWANGLDSQAQVQTLGDGLQKLAHIPLLIAVDQEGGPISRFNQWFSPFPGNQMLGMNNDFDLTEKTAFAVGQELRASGVNMNLAPVVDVNSNPQNPIISNRAYSNHPETVCAHGKMALEGYKRAHIIATLKHFPGHGDVEVDSHLDLPILRKTIKELEQTELLPFATLGALADVIMMAHILTPAIDEEYCATLSPKTVKYLRETLKFQGMILSDSLVMKGILSQCESIDEAAILSLNAGIDMLILGGKAHLELTLADVQRIHHSVVNAVKNGQIGEERLSEAVEKILALKRKYL
jgi:beta-N-acetylhexosaminidase